jgi:hypothetical protein
MADVDHTPIDWPAFKYLNQPESCLYCFGCIEFPERCNGRIRFPLYDNSCVDQTELLPQQSRHRHFKLPRPHEQRPHKQSPQSPSSVLMHWSSIAFIIDETDSSRPVGQSQRVYCLFNRIALFRARYLGFGCIQFLRYHSGCNQLLE